MIVLIWNNGIETLHDCYSVYNKAVVKKIELERQGFKVDFVILSC